VEVLIHRPALYGASLLSALRDDCAIIVTGSGRVGPGCILPDIQPQSLC
jgi:hypothetical protein